MDCSSCTGVNRKHIPPPACKDTVIHLKLIKKHSTQGLYTQKDLLTDCHKYIPMWPIACLLACNPYKCLKYISRWSHIHFHRLKKNITINKNAFLWTIRNCHEPCTKQDKVGLPI